MSDKSTEKCGCFKTVLAVVRSAKAKSAEIQVSSLLKVERVFF